MQKIPHKETEALIKQHDLRPCHGPGRFPMGLMPGRDWMEWYRLPDGCWLLMVAMHGWHYEGRIYDDSRADFDAGNCRTSPQLIFR